MSKSRHSAAHDFKSRWIYVIPLVIALLVLSSCAQAEVGPPPTGEETKQITKQIIEVKAVDQIVSYHCQSFWTEERFSKLSEQDLKAKFKEKYKVDAREFEFSFDEASHSTTIECQVYGSISKSADRYTADLLWFLTPLGLDFIDDDFEKSNHGLSWEGEIDGVPTTIEVECPPQDSIYEAWQDPVGHCHGHIWWPVS